MTFAVVVAIVACFLFDRLFTNAMETISPEASARQPK